MYGQLGANQVSREHYRSDTTKNYKDMSVGGQVTNRNLSDSAVRNCKNSNSFMVFFYDMCMIP